MRAIAFNCASNSAASRRTTRRLPRERRLSAAARRTSRANRSQPIARESTQAVGALHRQFSFNENCVYGAIHSGSDQIKSIDALNRDFGEGGVLPVIQPRRDTLFDQPSLGRANSGRSAGRRMPCVRCGPCSLGSCGIKRGRIPDLQDDRWRGERLAPRDLGG
jgi:hypothetical protein